MQLADIGLFPQCFPDMAKFTKVRVECLNIHNGILVQKPCEYSGATSTMPSSTMDVDTIPLGLMSPNEGYRTLA
jgi:hypothetical protein